MLAASLLGIIPRQMVQPWLKRFREIVTETPGLTMKGLSLKAGLNETAVRDIIKRGRIPSVEAFLALCEAVGVSPAYVLLGETPLRITIPVVGIVSAGEGWIPLQEGANESVEFELGGQDMIALEVRGDSMAPVYRNGDFLFCDKRTGRHLHNLVGLDCVVRTSDGRNFVKIVKKGVRVGVYNLKSYNPVVDDVENVTLEWAAPIMWIRRGAR